MGRVNALWFSLFIVLSVAITARSDDDCVYTAFIRTGSIDLAGTDSNVTLTLHDDSGHVVRFNNLKAWGGLMGLGHDYFERGNLDIFSGRGRCLTGPICAMNLTSDGSGAFPGWYCNYVDVSTTGIHSGCSQTLFKVEQWLATDSSPYELTAIRDQCGSDDVRAREGSTVSAIYGQNRPVLSVI